MTLVIDDEKTLTELERLSLGLAVPAEEVVRRAVMEKAEREGLSSQPWKTRQEFDAAVRRLREWSAAHRDPLDTRTPDEMMGYNEEGLFD